MVRVSGSGMGAGELIGLGGGVMTSGGVVDEGVVGSAGDAGTVGVVEDEGGGGNAGGTVDVADPLCSASGAGLRIDGDSDGDGGSRAWSIGPILGCQWSNRGGSSDRLQSRYWTFGSATGSELSSPRIINRWIGVPIVGGWARDQSPGPPARNEPQPRDSPALRVAIWFRVASC